MAMSRDLTPSRSSAVPVDPASLPRELQGRTLTVVSSAATMAASSMRPSLTHGGHRRHAAQRLSQPCHTRRAPDAMSVNLSSRQVRHAMDYVEGMRNGQELGALLGYQIERGLHENHPGVELDEFIYVLRERFPFISQKLTPVPDGTAAEVDRGAQRDQRLRPARVHARQDLSLRHRRPAGRGLGRGERDTSPSSTRWRSARRASPT